ncbi:MAG: hypothetical protein SOH81_08780 [Acetobacter sp.]
MFEDMGRKARATPMVLIVEQVLTEIRVPSQSTESEIASIIPRKT